jgi:hypothetical protein
MAEFIYFGNLSPRRPQFACGFRGLALLPEHERDIHHDARAPLPFADGSVKGFQSEDVFEHIEFECVGAILDEVYRCLAPGAMLRLSMPDYNSPLLRSRSVYDCDGNILCDAAMGGSVAGKMDGGLDVSFAGGGEAHLWFPTYVRVLELIVASQIRKCASIHFHHAWLTPERFVCEAFDQSLMPVWRAPPQDMRAGGKPVSLIADFVK